MYISLADSSSQDDSGASALFIAAQLGLSTVCEAILSHEQGILVGTDGNYASLKGIETRRANPFVPNDAGRTALMEACRLGHLNVVRLLIELDRTNKINAGENQQDYEHGYVFFCL